MLLNICFIAIDEALQIPVLICAINSLKNLNNNLQTTVIIDPVNKALLDETNYNGKIKIFDKSSFSNDVACSEASILNKSTEIKKQLHQSSAEDDFDLVVNLGFSQLSALLSSMIKHQSFLGLIYDEYSRMRIDGSWFSYLNSVHDDDSYNTFNYIDLVLSSLSSIVQGNNKIFGVKAELLKSQVANLPEEDTPYLRTKKNVYIYTNSSFMNGIAKDLVERGNESCKYCNITSGNEEKYKEADLVITDNLLFSLSSSALGNKVILISSEENVLYYPYGELNYIISPKSKSSKISEDILSLLGFILNHKDRALLITPNSEVLLSRLDNDGFMEYVPLLRKKINKKEFYSWIYRSVFKCTMGRAIRAGDPQRFLAFGEKYIDRVVDIDRQVEYLCENVMNKYNNDDVHSISLNFDDVIDQILIVKDIAFEGQKKAREFLNVVAVDSGNMEEIKKKRNELSEIDSKIYELINQEDCYAEPLIKSFVRDRDDAHVANLFPLAKKIMCLYEDLFSKISFLEEIIKELWKRIN
jgi:hypothetical protein